MSNRQTIFILSDPYTETGSLLYEMALSPFMQGGINIRRIPSDFITSGVLLDHPDSVLVLPGSKDGDGYRANMNGRGWQNVKTFLEAGGNALFICAAAYMGHESYSFHEQNGSTSRYTSLTSIFAGHADGPIQELYMEQRPWRNLMRTHEVVRLIHAPSTGSDVITAGAYSAGPRLNEPPKETARVIARFHDAVDQSPAIIAHQIGKGVAVVSSPAIEINGAAMVDSIRPANPEIALMLKFAEELATHERGRSRLWNDIWRNYVLPTTSPLINQNYSCQI